MLKELLESVEPVPPKNLMMRAAFFMSFDKKKLSEDLTRQLGHTVVVPEILVDDVLDKGIIRDRVIVTGIDTDADINRANAWLEKKGFLVIAPNRLRLVLEGAFEIKATAPYLKIDPLNWFVPNA